RARQQPAFVARRSTGGRQGSPGRRHRTRRPHAARCGRAHGARPEGVAVMTICGSTGLSESRRAVIMRAAVMLAAVVALGSFAQRVDAQQSQEKRDDLDVTMQIIVDPDAKLPDEVVRRIPLPARKSADPSPAAAGGQSDKSDAGPEKDRDN